MPVVADEPQSHRSLFIAGGGLAAIAIVGGVTAYMFLGGGGTDTETLPPPSSEEAGTIDLPPASPWTTLSSGEQLPTAMMGVAVHQDQLLIAGGLLADGTPSKAVVAFDGTAWTRKGELPVSISSNVLASLGGSVWSFGGISPALDPTTSNVIYTSADGVTWRRGGALPGTRYHTPLAIEDTTLWSLGGRYIDPASRSTALSRRVFRSTNGTTWNESGNNALPTGVGGAAAVSFNDALWLIGGGSLSADGVGSPGLNVYSSPDGTVWQAGANAPLTVADACVAVYQGKLWLVGGRTSEGASAAVFSSPDGTSWNLEAPLPQPLAAPGCATYHEALVVVGGGTAFAFGPMTAPAAPSSPDAAASSAAASAMESAAAQ